MPGQAERKCTDLKGNKHFAAAQSPKPRAGAGAGSGAGAGAGELLSLAVTFQAAECCWMVGWYFLSEIHAYFISITIT